MAKLLEEDLRMRAYMLEVSDKLKAMSGEVLRSAPTEFTLKIGKGANCRVISFTVHEGVTPILSALLGMASSEVLEKALELPDAVKGG